MNNATLIVIDCLVLPLGALTIFYKWKLYRLTHSRAFLLVILALLWAMAVRILVVVFPDWGGDTEAVMGFWIIIAIAAVVMWRDISRWLK
jgi:nitrate/nitrite transporter NarK